MQLWHSMQSYPEYPRCICDHEFDIKLYLGIAATSPDLKLCLKEGLHNCLCESCVSPTQVKLLSNSTDHDMQVKVG